MPARRGTVTPRLVVGDGAAAIEFYQLAFGAHEIGERFMGPHGEVIHAEVQIGESVVMITEDSDPDLPAGSPAAVARAVSALMALNWQDVDAAWEQAVTAGAEVIYPLADHPYGERGGRLRDPFGQQWMMSQRIAADGDQVTAFVPRGPCRVETDGSVWLIDADPMGGGRYVALPESSAPSGFDWSVSAGEWMQYDWIRLSLTGSERRLQFGRGEWTSGAAGVWTEAIRGLVGDWSTEPRGTDSDRLSPAFVVLCGPASHAPEQIVGPFDSARSAEAWAADRQEAGRYAVAQEMARPRDL